MVGGLEDDRIPIIAVSERGRGGLQQLSFDPHADYGPLSGFRSLSGGGCLVVEDKMWLSAC